MVIQSIFPPGREILANFNWIDYISATGYITFDAFNAVDSTGDNYILLDSTHASKVIASYGLGDPGTGATILSSFTAGAGQDADLDFDLSPFQLPRTIEGNAFVRIPLAAESAEVTGVYVIARLRKYSGVTETTIVSTQSPTDAVMSSTHQYSWTLKLVVPKTHFKKGDILRLTIEIYSTDADPILLAHNPNDTAISTEFNAGNTRLTLSVPFKLDFM